jgi:hypothetical protein
VLGVEAKVLPMLGKCCASELHPRPFLCIFNCSSLTELYKSGHGSIFVPTIVVRRMWLSDWHPVGTLRL